MSIAIKERPILFSAPMVRAILDGRKTQTRRVVKPQPTNKHLSYMAIEGGAILNGPDYPDGENDFVKCPYGQPGDRLWVRETWCHAADDSGRFKYNAKGDLDASCCHYRADGYEVHHIAGEETKNGQPKSPWCSPIHMPRWASRITLEITDVRVERLQDISEEDAEDEGMDDAPNPDFDEEDPCDDEPYTFVAGFMNYLEQHGHMDWEANPWVWAD